MKELEEIAFLSHKILDLNKQLIESEKIKSQFLSLVASKLNNPMTALLGLIPHLDPQRSCSQEVFDLVHQEVLHLHFQIQNLVMAAEIEGGMLQIDYASVTIQSIIEDVLRDLQYLIDAQGISITLSNTLSSPFITDPKKLYLILKNIIANGCSYGTKGGVIDISITKSKYILTLEISNQGDGPRVEFKPQVFQRFAQTAEGDHGLGIGLSIAKELCGSLNGVLDYKVAKKTVTFVVSLDLLSKIPNSDAYGSDEFLFESFDSAIEL